MRAQLCTRQPPPLNVVVIIFVINVVRIDFYRSRHTKKIDKKMKNYRTMKNVFYHIRAQSVYSICLRPHWHRIHIEIHIYVTSTAPVTRRTHKRSVVRLRCRVNKALVRCRWCGIEMRNRNEMTSSISAIRWFSSTWWRRTPHPPHTLKCKLLLSQALNSRVDSFLCSVYFILLRYQFVRKDTPRRRLKEKKKQWRPSMAVTDIAHSSHVDLWKNIVFFS